LISTSSAVVAFTIVTTSSLHPRSASQPVLASYSINKPGFDAGAGVSFGSRWRAKFYAEARYNRMFANGPDTDFIPVTFGVRW